MNKKSGSSKASAEKLVKNIRRKTRQTYSAEEKIRIVLAGMRGDESISALCRREGIAESLYYSWSKEFLEAGKRRLSVRFASGTDRVVTDRTVIAGSYLGNGKVHLKPPLSGRIMTACHKLINATADGFDVGHCLGWPAFLFS